MNLTVCPNHTIIPQYQNIELFPKDTYRIKPSVDVVNGELATLTPKWQIITQSIGLVSLAALAMKAISSLAAPLVVPFSVIFVGTAIFKYKSYQSEVKVLEKEIHSLFQKYTKEFTLLEQETAHLFTINSDDFDLIQEYVPKNPLQYTIRTVTHYKLDGGNIGFWSVKPLRLQTVCQETNSDKVIETYKPWIDLLPTLAKDEKIPKDFLRLVGKMGGFKRGLMDLVFCIFEKYDCTYGLYEKGQFFKRQITCIHKSDPSQNCAINTPAECLAFLKKVLESEHQSK